MALNPTQNQGFEGAQRTKEKKKKKKKVSSADETFIHLEKTPPN